MPRGVGIPGLHGRSARVALALAAVAAVWWALTWWAEAERASPDRHGFRAAWFSGLEVAYPLAVAGLLVIEGVAVGWLVAARRRRGRGRTAIARAALAGAASLLALLGAEAAAALRLAWVHRLPELAMVRQAPPRTGPGDDVTVVVAGGSSAEGVPYRDWLSVGEVVAWKLRRLFPQRTFHLEVQARAGWTLEQAHQKLAAYARRPDLVILYAGHNEFASRYGWSSEVTYYQDDPAPPWPVGLACRLGEASPVCRLVREVRDRELVAGRPPGRGRPVVDVPSCTPAQSEARLADFERRVETILRDLNRSGVLTVVVVPPANDADFAPNRSVLPPSRPRAERRDFARRVAEARALEAADPARAVAAYRALVARQPGFALTHFRLALCLERAGAPDEAYREFVRARDLDGHPMRCPTRFQDVYRRLAPRYGAVLVDGQAVLRDHHPRGRLDDHLFNDGVHPSLLGTVALASGILTGLKQRQAFGWPGSLPVPAVDPEGCADHFDLTASAWKEVCRFAAGFYRATAAIGCDAGSRQAKARRYEDALRGLEAGSDADDLRLPGIGTRPIPRGEGPCDDWPRP